MNEKLQESTNLHILNKYDDLNLYEYRKVRKEEKVKKSKTKSTDNKYFEIRESIWNYLLGNYESGYNSYQAYSMHSYIPKPAPKDIDANSAYITVLEAQRRFLQYKNDALLEDKTLRHLDLNSAYLTALANVKHSLKYSSSYKLTEISDLQFDLQDNPIHKYIITELFNIIKVTCTMPYSSLINLFAPNNKIIYNGKEVGPTNIPKVGDMVAVRFELFVGEKYKVDSWELWTSIFRDYDITYKTVTVYSYTYVSRKQMFTIEDLQVLLDTIRTFSKEEQKLSKISLVAFTGQLINIDPGRRLLMLARMEEVMRRIYMHLRTRTTVHGIQIDGIYFENFSTINELQEIAWEIGREVYDLDIGEITKEQFSKLQVLSTKQYKETTFRVQGVK